MRQNTPTIPGNDFPSWGYLLLISKMKLWHRGIQLKFKGWYSVCRSRLVRLILEDFANSSSGKCYLFGFPVACSGRRSYQIQLIKLEFYPRFLNII